MKTKRKDNEANSGAMPVWMQKFIRLFLDYQVALLEQARTLSGADMDKLFQSDTCGTMDNLGDMLGIPKDQTDIGYSGYSRDWLFHMPSDILDGESTIEESLNELRIEYGLLNN